MSTEPTLTHEPTHERAVVYSEKKKKILVIFVGIIPFQTLILHSSVPPLYKRGEAEWNIFPRSMQ